MLDPSFRDVTAPQNMREKNTEATRLAVVVPTLNEEKNVVRLYERLVRVLAGFNWELIFVDDDSKDGTLVEIAKIAVRDPRVRHIHRVNRKGLSSACTEGILSTCQDYVVIMDSDLQHDENAIPAIVAKLVDEDRDIVVGSRYVKGGGTGNWTPSREKMSRFATVISKFFFGIEIQDPMSGFFGFQRQRIVPFLKNVNGRGFKILFDLLTSSRLRVAEIPYEFRNRKEGDSKLNFSTLYDFFVSLVYVFLRRKIPADFISFSLVGGSGVVLHLLVLGSLTWLSVDFLQAQLTAALVAMTSNFFINNITTHRSRKIKGNVIFFSLFKFCLLCLLGLGFNLIVAEWMFRQTNLWLAGGIAGSVVSAVWNYATSSVFVWRRTN